MVPLSRKRIVSFMLPALVFLLCGLHCTKKDNPVSSGDDDPDPIPTLVIVTPAEDSTFETGTDSISFTAVIANSDYIDSIEVNGKKVSISNIDDDTLTLRLALSDDTTTFNVTVYYQKTKSLEESVIVFRETGSIITTGMAKISGTLLQESSGAAGKRLAKPLIATNAQGVKAEVEKVIPISGADIMIYDAEALSTASDTVVQTDSTGKWAVELEPGNYFIFAVYFDRENLEIVTTALPDIKAQKDMETATDTAIATSDDINPMLMTFLDAAEANDDNVFIGSDVPVGLPIVMSFSEPMTRVSAGDATSGVILGEVDADSSSLPIVDTIEVKKLWGPNGKELRLIPENELIPGKTYKVIIPSGIKDLALNKLDNDYTGIFVCIEAAELPDFALKTTSPADGDTIPQGFPVECIFTRQIDVLSLNKEYTLSSDDDTADVYFEVKGNIARLTNKHEWKAGAEYTLTINPEVKDLLEDELGTKITLSFTAAPKDAFEEKEGIEGMVATAVKKFMGAYLAGDLESFSQFFHPSFEMIESTPDGEERLQLQTFLDMMRSDIEVRNRLAKFGIIAPVFYYPIVDGNRFIAWKLSKGSVEVYFEDMGPDGGIGRVPRVLSTDNKDITDSVEYVERGIVYNGETLYFAPDMSDAFIDENSRENDPTIFGKRLQSETDVETQEILLTLREDFIIRNLSAKEGNDTAQVMIELITEESFPEGKCPYPVMDPDNPPPAVEKRVTALQTKMIFTSGKWMVLQIVEKGLYEGNKEEFERDKITDDDFVIQNFDQTRPIEFVSPKHKSASVETPIVLEWSVDKTDGIGGYLVVIANELSGGNQGLLMFTKETSITISENGAVDGDAKILSVDPKTLHAPIPPFGARLTSFTAEDADVYVWKVMGIKDTVASAIQPNVPVHIIADSDFGSHRGIGIFTLLDEMPDIAENLTDFDPDKPPPDDHFADRDGDMFPDWIEIAYATSPDDPGSYPNFTLDSDLDGYADFMEVFAESDPEDEASKPQDSDPADNIPDKLQTRPEWRPQLNIDDDKDGFPNEVEMIFGTDPWNADSKPSKSMKASVPVNTYFGGIKIGNQGWKRIDFSLISDTTGNFAYVDSTELQGLARNGTDLTVNLFWNNGEWVFYLALVEGPNAGRFIKVRFRRDGNILRGPVDLADMEPGGGPFIGDFVASLEPIENFDDIGGGPIVIIDPDDPGGDLHLGQPPMDRLERPEEGTEDMQLVLGFPENADITVKVTVGDKTVDFERPFWSPGQFPSFGCHAPQTPEMYWLEGDLFRTGDSLVLMGIMEFDNEDPNGGMYRERFDFIVFITGIDDPRRPAGTWNGWLSKPVGPIHHGPNPFIGSKDSVDAALERTGNKGIIMETDEIVTIESAAQEPGMNVWRAAVGEDTYFIMEVKGDFESVLIKDKDGTLCIVLSSGGGPGILTPFAGDSATIVAALDAASNEVKVNAPNPFTITVDPATLRKELPPDAPEGEMGHWVVADANDPNHLVVFTGQDDDNTVLRIEDGIPVVNDMMGPGPHMTPFQGDSALIVTALEGSENMVTPADAPNPSPIEVDPATLMKMQNPDNPDEFGYVVNEAGTAANRFIFVGEDNDPMILKMDGNRPMVFKEMGMP